MRTESEHEVEHDRGDIRISTQGTDRCVALARVDHWVRSAAGVVVSTHVDEAMALAVGGRGLSDWGIRAAAQTVGDESQLRFVAERATGEQAAHLALARCHRGAPLLEVGDLSIADVCGWQRHPARQRQRQVGGMAQRARRVQAWRQGFGRRTQKMQHHRLAGGSGGGLDAPRDGGRRRFGHQHDHAGLAVGGERGQTLQHRDAADGLAQVAPTGAQRLRDAAALVVDAAAELLQAGARCGDDADVAAAHDIRESQRHAVDDRGAAVRPHHQQVSGAGECLDLELFSDRNVV